MDDILNIDECLSDSFSLSSDTDIRNIVDQWKHSDLPSTTTDNRDLKSVDTRTFTRPRKKVFSASDVNNAFSTRRASASSDVLLEDHVSTSAAIPVSEPLPSMQQPSIDLKIGGLVTSMQRSFLGDVSPPPTILMESSFEPMGNSLITSSDFSNINEFINGNEDSLAMAQFNQYRLTDAINDRNFLERLTNYDESLFTKDADINNIDANHLIYNGNGRSSSSGGGTNSSFSGNSTLQNSTDSSSTNLGKHDETFIPNRMTDINDTFNAIGDVDRTFVQASSATKANESSNRNGTFDLIKLKNSTFDAPNGRKENEPLPNGAEKITALEDEELSLHGTFNVATNIEYKKPDNIADGTMNVSKKYSAQAIGSPQLAVSPLLNGISQRWDAFQSTPARKDIVRKSRRSEALANISPILSEDLKVQANNSQIKNVGKFIDVEIDEFPVCLRSTTQKTATRTSNPMGINTDLRDDERQSLANFEEFENTLLILENNKNEEEFDDLLNSFSANVRSPLSQKVRQSLDNIKKRHSLINMEKQQQDELSREKIIHTTLSSIRIGENGFANEKNKLNESFNRAAMHSSTSSSGSGERLLRRSRLFDDVLTTSGSSDRSIQNSGGEYQNQLNSSGVSMICNNNKETHELKATELISRKGQSYVENELEKTDKTMVYNTEETKPTNNRDRFKTIRIFKKPPENAIQVPDADETTTIDDATGSVTPKRTFEAFAQKNTNSPKSSPTVKGENYNQTATNTKAINTMTFKRSALVRPKQLSGLSRETYAKSNSHEMLSNNVGYDLAQYQQHNGQARNIPHLKSPMGIKSKSVHNLATSNNYRVARGDNVENPVRFTRPSMDLTACAQPSVSNAFKIPMAKPLATLRQRSNALAGPQKLSLIRPSSGYYSYNVKRTDSDTESGRFSSNNSLSSGSSKSSLHRVESTESGANSNFVQSSSNNNPNSTFVQPTASSTVPSKPLVANGNVNLARVSNLRQPSQIRKSGLPRPMTIPKR